MITNLNFILRGGYSCERHNKMEMSYSEIPCRSDYTKITVAQNYVALSYHRVRRLYFLAVIFTATIVSV